MLMPTMAIRSIAAAILAVALLTATAVAKDVPNTGTARPAPPLSPAQRAALATKDAVRRAQEAQVRLPGPAAKPGALVFVGPQRQPGLPSPVALKGAGPDRAKAPAGNTDVPDEATLQMLRSRMGPERAAAFGIAKATAPPVPVRSATAAPATPATPAKDAHR